ncbi:helicase-associated domain-containing protein [Cryobacterium sp. PH29-G1]|uniref:helicase-associated domain-containing protein n=1 Tax=Cryobacterium sp. PH29-G1 TaxID=3046211 RepID=UPI0024B9A941|nr:helicase-associated domain-containing protein [Cryobacterium sp. PH29-G1]MDJ0350689.1 helicase-associated domain-containing protein [Cryobacterium sp. PH29-G1]
MPDAELRHVIAVRGVTANGIHDFFDLAEALLEPSNVQLALSHLDRPTLAVLAVAGQLTSSGSVPTLNAVTSQLSELGSADVALAEVTRRVDTLHVLLLAEHNDGCCIPYAAVAAHLARWPAQGLPGAGDLAITLPPAAITAVPGSEIAFIDQLAAERAFAVVSSISELINELSREPARQLSRGGLGLPDTKRLAAVMTVEVDLVTSVLAVAARADLLALSDGYWMETEAGEAWLLERTTDRWAALAAAWQAALPPIVADSLPRQVGLLWGDGLTTFIAWLYPAGGEWMLSQLTEFARDAEVLGITAHDTTSTAGSSVLRGDPEAAIATMANALPAEVGAVYLQHDLSVVAPGPLSPAIDSRLRGMADVESRELASSYRITAASVNRALAAGEDAESLLAFLASISLTGIPQPVEYLVNESAARYGRVRVGRLTAGPTAQTTPAAATGAETVYLSYVSSADAALLGTIAVDQTLAALALVRSSDDEHLLSRFAGDAVFWALRDARYPVAAENEQGEIVHLRRHPIARVTVAPRTDPARNLVEKLRVVADNGTSVADAWLARQLDTAIKAKQTILVSIAMPGGAVVDYLLEPASVSNGRFRARDRRADIERTLPLKSIRSITPAP